MSFRSYLSLRLHQYNAYFFHSICTLCWSYDQAGIQWAIKKQREFWCRHESTLYNICVMLLCNWRNIVLHNLQTAVFVLMWSLLHESNILYHRSCLHNSLMFMRRPKMSVLGKGLDWNSNRLRIASSSGQSLAEELHHNNVTFDWMLKKLCSFLFVILISILFSWT